MNYVEDIHLRNAFINIWYQALTAKRLKKNINCLNPVYEYELDSFWIHSLIFNFLFWFCWGKICQFIFKMTINGTHFKSASGGLICVLTLDLLWRTKYSYYVFIFFYLIRNHVTIFFISFIITDLYNLVSNLNSFIFVWTLYPFLNSETTMWSLNKYLLFCSKEIVTL